MPKYAIGTKVTQISTQQKGTIIDCKEGRGRVLYTVIFPDGEAKVYESELISDINISDPFECCKAGKFGVASDFARINTSFKIKNTSNNTISSLKASKTIFKAYQFKPLLKFLNSENKRLLIADEVGLGKTIEAGHILMELSARKELRNVLIICPKMLQEKWRVELKEKFNFSFQTFSESKDLVTAFSNGNVKAIINYEKIQSKIKDNKETNILIKYIIDHHLTFDMILCDEAHRLRNLGTKTYKGAEVIIPQSSATVFLTATPIMIDESNLYNLLHLLDGQRFNNLSIFNTFLSLNKPFVKAISQLNNNVPLPKIADELSNAVVENELGTSTVSEEFSEIKLYQKILNDLHTKTDDLENRVALQYDISSLSQMNNIFSRTRKREVTTDYSQPIRKPVKIEVSLDQLEKEQYDKVISDYSGDNTYYDEYGDAKFSQGHALGLIQKKRRIASSVYGYLNSEENLNNGFDQYAKLRDAKVDQLIKVIKKRNDNNEHKIIVFALFKNTLKYLAIRLAKAGYKTLMIHGDIKEREGVIEQFKKDPNIEVLLSSEVGSEGLDMQFCNAIVNYDLPWNPMVVEQRIGRIDRFGQESAIVHIYSIIVKKTIQEEIYDRLLSRIGIFECCIGDLEAILDSGSIGKDIKELEQDIYCNNLTEEERNKRYEDICKAVIREKDTLAQLSEGLSDTLTNDAYFKAELQKIQDNFRYITDLELKNYVLTIIRHHLTECDLEELDNGLYLFKIPASNKKCLSNFLLQYLPVSASEDMITLFNKFKSSILDKTQFKLTFDQEIAYQNKEAEFINAYHPLITAAREYFEKSYSDPIKAFQFALPLDKIKINNNLEPGSYYLAVYTLSYTKSWFGKDFTNEILVPIVYNTQQGVILNNKDVAERFFGLSQLYATPTSIPFETDSNLIEELNFDFEDEIKRISDEFIEDQKIRLESSKELQKKRIEAFYDLSIKKAEMQIESIIEKANAASTDDERNSTLSILPAREGLLKKEQQKKEDELLRVDSSQITYKTPIIQSLSQIIIS